MILYLRVDAVLSREPPLRLWSQISQFVPTVRAHRNHDDGDQVGHGHGHGHGHGQTVVAIGAHHGIEDYDDDEFIEY